MLISNFFNYKKNIFLSKKKYFLDTAKKYFEHGNLSQAKKIETAVAELQKESDQLSLHFLSGKSGLRVFFKVWSFWQHLSNLEDSLKSIFRQLFETIFFVGGTVFLIKRFWFAFYIVPSGSAEPNLLVGDRICGIKYPYLFSKPNRGDLVIIDQPNFPYSQNSIVKTYQKYIGLPLLGILPAGPESWVKRLVGLPGDRVELKINDQGKPETWINGEIFREPSLNPWPVILLKRKRGFIPQGSPLLKMPIISSIINILALDENWKSMSMRYTFDPTKPYDNQPFYNFTESEIIKNSQTNQPYIEFPDQAERKDRMKEFVVPKGYLFLLGDNRRNSADGRNWGVIPESLVLGRASFILWSVDGTESWWFVEFIKNPITFFTKKLRWNRILRSVHPFKELPTN